MPQKYTEEEINKVRSEYRKQTEILNKYWRVLVKKGLKIAKERGLESIAVQEGETDFDADITIYRGNENVDAEQLIALTKDAYLGIYTNYLQRRLKHKELEIQLTEIKSYLESTLSRG